MCARRRSERLTQDQHEQLVRLAKHLAVGSHEAYSIAGQLMEAAKSRFDMAITRRVATGILADARTRLRADYRESEQDIKSHARHSLREIRDECWTQYERSKAPRWLKEARLCTEAEARLAPDSGDASDAGMPDSITIEVVDKRVLDAERDSEGGS